MTFLTSWYYLFLGLTLVCFGLGRSPEQKKIILLLASLIFLGSFGLFYLFLFLIPLILSYVLAPFLTKDLSRRYQYMFGAICFVSFPFMIYKVFLGLPSLYPFRAQDLVMPIGLSFYTFQILSYMLDVYRDKITPIKSFTDYALYVSFFPQLVAGPIERTEDLLPQFNFRENVTIKNILIGLFYISLGIFKKLVLAEILTLIIQPVFSNPQIYTGMIILIVVLTSRYLIFCDFSGYSDIAIGSGRLFGIKLINNFNRPFAATSLGDFWRRWHISLYKWIVDYIYYPLLISPFRLLGIYFCTTLTFFFLGMWHGFTLNFAAFALFQGVAISIGHRTVKWRTRLYKKYYFMHFLGWAYTFVFLIGLPTLLFKTGNLKDAFYLIKEFFIFLTQLIKGESLAIDLSQVPDYRLWGLVLGFGFLELFQYYKGEAYFCSSESKATFAQFMIYFITIWSLIILFGVFDNASNFIYFSF